MDVITCHIEADFDALASMAAAHKLYPDAKVVFPGAQEKALREFIAAGHLPDLPIITLRELDRDAIGRLIVVDARKAERLGPLESVARRPEVEIHLYDHHPPVPDGLRGTVEVSRPVGANTTLMLELLEERDLPVSSTEATLYLLGLYQETGCLTHDGTTPEDCEAAARLLRTGASLDVVTRYLPGDFDAAQIALLDDLLQGATHVNVHGADVVLAQASREMHVSGLGNLATRAAGILGARSFFAIARMADRVFVAGRSRDPAVNAAQTLSALGGGGHPAAAAASVKGRSLVEVRDALLEALRSHVEPATRARDCMTGNVRSVPPETPMAEVGALLAREHFDTVPVVAKGRILGLISRQTTDRALHHELGAAPVAQYMSTEFATLGPDAHIEEIAYAMLEHHQRLVPILEEGALAGVVTRQDLFHEARAREELIGLLPPPREGESGEAEVRDPLRRPLRRIMEERLPGPVMEILRSIGIVAVENGAPTFVVGGFVRDLLLGVPDYDIDIVVEGDGIALARSLATCLGGRARTHEMFGTASILLPGRSDLPGGGEACHIDVATARKERYEYPGALPAVGRSSLRRDLYRRDFTINTLAVNLSPGSFGELLDFFGGQRDIKERRIRVLHGLSFVEDPTRAFRALRFEQRFHFRVGKFTERLFATAVRHLEGVSGGRILNELVRTLEEPRPAAILRRLEAKGLLRALEPSLALGATGERRLENVAEALGWFRLLYTEERVTAWIPAWLALTAGLDASATGKLESRLGIRGGLARRIEEAGRGASEALEALGKRKDGPPSAIAAALRPLSIEGLLWLMALSEAEGVKRAVSRFITEWRHVKPVLVGGDLIDLGMSEGPLLGAALRSLRDARIDGVITTQREEIARVRRLLEANKSR